MQADYCGDYLHVNPFFFKRDKWCKNTISHRDAVFATWIMMPTVSAGLLVDSCVKLTEYYSLAALSLYTAKSEHVETYYMLMSPAQIVLFVFPVPCSKQFL